MAMGGYSLGGMMDPDLMQYISQIPESPYATMSRQDPSFAPAAAQYVGNLASPSMPSPDTAMGVGQPLLSDHSDEGPSALEIFGGIATAPFRALGLVKQGLEDALGHRNSRRRDMEDFQIEYATKLGLGSDALKPWQKQALWPEQFAQERAAYDARSYSEGDSAHGRNTNGLPLPQARKTGIWEWFTGETSRIRARDLARAQMAQRVVQDNIKAEALRSEQALGDLRRTQTEGAQWDVTQGYKYGDLEKQWGIREQQANVGARDASAASSYASADYSRAAIGNLGADNARADEAARRAEVAHRLGLRSTSEEIRGKKLDNRGKVLDLRREAEQRPYGDDTGYDRLGRAFKLSQFITKYNTAQDERERKAVVDAYQLRTKTMGSEWFGDGPEREEPDFDVMPFKPEPQAKPDAADETTAASDPYVTPPAGTTGAVGGLDRSSADNFVRSAKALGLNDAEIKALWAAGSR